MSWYLLGIVVSQTNRSLFCHLGLYESQLRWLFTHKKTPLPIMALVTFIQQRPCQTTRVSLNQKNFSRVTTIQVEMTSTAATIIRKQFWLDYARGWISGGLVVVGHRDRRLSKLVSTSTVPPSLLQGFNHQTGLFSVWQVELVFRLAYMFWILL